MALRDEPFGHRTMAVETLRLKVRTEVAADRGSFVPVEPEPAEPVEDPFDHVLRRALEVRVLDPEHEDAPSRRANSQLNRAVRAPPTCR